MDKKTFFKTRKSAAVVMVILLLLALRLGSSRSLGKQFNAVADAFENGTGAADVSIAECLTERDEYARNLLTVASRYLAGSDPTVKAVNVALDALEKVDGVSDKYGANLALTDIVAKLYDKLLGLRLSDSDELLVKKTFQNFKSLNDQMSHAAYNGIAQEYNAVFKASPLSGISGQREAELFR